MAEINLNSMSECLSKQLSELELFQSMYPNDNEIKLTNAETVDIIKSFIKCGSEYTPPHLDFVLKITVDDKIVEICINLPTLYPIDPPDILVRSNQLNRQQETELNRDFTNYIKDITRGDYCLLTAVSWIQDKASSFTKIHSILCNEKEVNQDIICKFSRYWIYSHHIYNKKKRDAIMSKAKEFEVNGFCLPGKPGIICIEGNENSCKEWWRTIKSLNWQKIIIKHIDFFNPDEISLNQKFYKFEELHFPNPGPSSNKHDMSKFYKHLENLGLSDVLNSILHLNEDA